MSEAPDLPDFVIGYRSWSGAVSTFGIPAPTLEGWVPGENAAHCHRSGDHDPPEDGCSCGLYAYHDPRGARGVGGAALGAVRAWGKLRVTHEGFRAQYAEIVALASRGGEVVGPDGRPVDTEAGRWIETVGENYGVPVVPLARLKEVARQSGAPVPKELLPDDRPAAPAARRAKPRRRPAPSAPAPPAPRIGYHEADTRPWTVLPGIAAFAGALALISWLGGRL